MVGYDLCCIFIIHGTVKITVSLWCNFPAGLCHIVCSVQNMRLCSSSFSEHRISSFNFERNYFCFHSSLPFFIPATTANDLRLRRISNPDFIHYIFCPIFILQNEPVFPFFMLSAKQGNYWYHYYNVFGMTRALTRDWTRDLPHSKPALYP